MTVSAEEARRWDPRLAISVRSSRVVGSVSRRLGLGAGTTAGGSIAQRLDPRAIEKLTRDLRREVVLVTGTNGKSTTSLLLADMLRAADREVIHNRSGANLANGILSELTQAHRTPARPRHAVTLLEVDEAVMPEMLMRTDARMIVLTNIFRDQLDRYGEIDHTLARWRAALLRLAEDKTVVVNADDPHLVDLTDGLSARRVLYGLARSPHQLAALPPAAESLACADCGKPYEYDSLFLGHLGHWHCPAGCRRRPAPTVEAVDIELAGLAGQSVTVSVDDRGLRLDAPLPGIYNTFNITAAVTAAHELGVSGDAMRQATMRYDGVFGRAECVQLQGRQLTLLLVKNPVGTDEVLRVVGDHEPTGRTRILFVLNDNAADGRDVSWIWDVDFESLLQSGPTVSCAGTRWADLRNRLHYAGLLDQDLHGLGVDPMPAVDTFVGTLARDEHGFVLATYSAMLRLETELARRRGTPLPWAS